MPYSTKRAKVMARSKKLGHCICDPRKPCPCPLFVEQDVCTCAGERAEAAPAQGAAALTKHSKNPGCASKIPPAFLRRVLGQLPAVEDPRLLVGLGTADDAGVVDFGGGLFLVQTVDVFAPSVDDPYLFGQIAACNSLSDVYAMGGTPVSALSVISYPIYALDEAWMVQMLKGGMDKLAEADVVLAGGHSIHGEEVLFGFAVTGVVAKDGVIANAGARAGDALILTKPVGTGIVAFAAQIGRASAAAMGAAGASMAALNRAASEVMRSREVHACTDVTGFGLLGHLFNVARESGVAAEVWWDAVPLFESVLDLAKEGVVSGAAERNQEYAGAIVEVADGVPEHAVEILYDAQTSGGLLIALPEAEAKEALDDFHEAGCEGAAVVGRITGHCKGGRIMVSGKEPGKTRRSAAATQSDEGAADCCAAREPVASAQPAECCAPGAGPADASATQNAFSQFMASAFSPGALDIVQKEVAAIALSVAVQCEPCMRIHLEKAKGMGLTKDEIQEAAWMGIAFGGCRARMFWQQFEAEV